MLRVYIDDSGKPDQSPVQVLAGYMASAEQWAKFANEWQAILDLHGIDAFRMAEAWRMHRKYRTKGALCHNSAIVQFIECIKRHVEFAFVSSVPYEAYNHWFAVDQVNGHRSFRPYFFGFYTLMSQVYRHAYRFQYDQRVEVVFDEQGGESQRYVLAAMDQYRKVAGSGFHDLVIPTPTFQNDKDALPLQAADLLAWLVRRDAFNARKEKDRTKLPEALMLGEAVSMPHEVKIWSDDDLELASSHLAGIVTGKIPSLI